MAAHKQNKMETPPPPPYPGSSDGNVTATVPKEPPQKKVVKKTSQIVCFVCAKKLTGQCQIADNKLFCWTCFRDSACPKCKAHTFFNGKCTSERCLYARMKCDGCKRFFDNGVIRMGQVLCNEGCGKPKTSVLNALSVVKADSYLPYDSPGCYNRAVCQGHCTCDSPN